ncbi:MAG: hypothetical protein L6R43_19345 [Planctomycetes bacterium]|nr:hypothetical protein [Planctomycetota bacterium]
MGARVLLDAHVLVSAFLARGLRADLPREVLSRHEIATGEVVLEELRRTQVRKFGATRAEAVSAAVEADLLVTRDRDL